VRTAARWLAVLVSMVVVLVVGVLAIGTTAAYATGVQCHVTWPGSLAGGGSSVADVPYATGDPTGASITCTGLLANTTYNNVEVFTETGDAWSYVDDLDYCSVGVFVAGNQHGGAAGHTDGAGSMTLSPVTATCTSDSGFQSLAPAGHVHVGRAYVYSASNVQTAYLTGGTWDSNISDGDVELEPPSTTVGATVPAAVTTGYGDGLGPIGVVEDHAVPALFGLGGLSTAIATGVRWVGKAKGLGA
jgi:hypothetical protein